jgi:hypothetical protein
MKFLPFVLLSLFMHGVLSYADVPATNRSEEVEAIRQEYALSDAARARALKQFERRLKKAKKNFKWRHHVAKYDDAAAFARGKHHQRQESFVADRDIEIYERLKADLQAALDKLHNRLHRKIHRKMGALVLERASEEQSLEAAKVLLASSVVGADETRDALKKAHELLENAPTLQQQVRAN